MLRMYKDTGSILTTPQFKRPINVFCLQIISRLLIALREPDGPGINRADKLRRFLCALNTGLSDGRDGQMPFLPDENKNGAYLKGCQLHQPPLW